jgi:hypothetical protein
MNLLPFQEQFDRFIRQLRVESEREIPTGSLEYIAYYLAYIEGRLDAMKEIQQEQQQSIIFNDLKEPVHHDS